VAKGVAGAETSPTFDAPIPLGRLESDNLPIEGALLREMDLGLIIRTREILEILSLVHRNNTSKEPKPVRTTEVTHLIIPHNARKQGRCVVGSILKLKTGIRFSKENAK
jgi:hypothetical protein